MRCFSLSVPLVGVLLLAVFCVKSQVVPSSWNSTIKTPTAERIRLAGAAIDVAIDKLDGDGLFDSKAYGVTGNLYSQMAQFDIATNQTKYQDKLEQFLQFQERRNNNFSNPTTYNTLSFGHAAAKAYAAYKNPVFLQYAIESWWVGRRRTISQSDLSAGKIAGKNFTLAKVCERVTMAGGTFWDDQEGDPNVAGAATGYFLVLSALLAEATPDPMYLQAANESADFIRSHLYSFRGIVQETITVDVNDALACQVVNLYPISSGLMIEGLSILASITNSASTEKLLSDLVVAVIPTPDWQGANGIVSQTGDLAGDMNLVQGLGTFYVRNTTNSTLRQYVGDYIAVQFNAVTNLATSNNTNIYGSTWTGPPNAFFGGDNQTTALGALLSSIALGTPSSVSSSSSLSPSSTNSPSPVGGTTPRPKSSHLGTILGGSLGGLAALILMILWYLHRRRSTRNTAHSSRSPQPPPFLTSSINPFTTQTSIIASFSKHGEHRGPRLPFPTNVAAREEGDRFNVIANTDLGNVHAVNDPPETHQMDPSVITHGDRNMSGENSPVGRNPAPIHPLVTQETQATVITGEDRVNVNVEDSATAVLPTEVLLRILSQRMQGQQWDEGDNPPDYATAT